MGGPRRARAAATTRPLGASSGTSFAVWAPNAQGVRVAGDFNYWDGRAHPMRSLGSTGVWELFVPGVGDGTHYKFEVLGADGVLAARRPTRWRSRTEVPPATASVVFTSDYEWGDDEWLAERGADATRTSAPMSIYEVHLGSWRQGLTYRELADELVDYVADLGFTHVELLPVAEHPFGGSWGYQVSSLLRADVAVRQPRRLPLPRRPAAPGRHRRHRRLGARPLPQGRLGAGPLRRHRALRAPGPAARRAARLGHATSSTSAAREVRNFLVANALYWLEEFHIDGLRVDAVASMLYLDYSREAGEWAAERVRRPREPRGGGVPAGGQRHGLQARPRHR